MTTNKISKIINETKGKKIYTVLSNGYFISVSRKNLEIALRNYKEIVDDNINYEVEKGSSYVIIKLK